MCNEHIDVLTYKNINIGGNGSFVLMEKGLYMDSKLSRKEELPISFISRNPSESSLSLCSSSETLESLENIVQDKKTDMDNRIITNITECESEGDTNIFEGQINVYEEDTNNENDKDTSVLQSQEFLPNHDTSIRNIYILDDQECAPYQILESTPIKNTRFSTFYKALPDTPNVDFFRPGIVLPSAENEIKNENSQQYEKNFEISTGNERKGTENIEKDTPFETLCPYSREKDEEVFTDTLADVGIFNPNAATEEEAPSDVSYVNISMHEVEAECNPRILQTSLMEKTYQANCYAHFFRHYQSPVFLFAKLFMYKYY